MFYEILLIYFGIRFTLELLIDDIPETDIRKCNCTFCSGLHILN